MLDVRSAWMASVVRQANGLISDRLNESGIGNLAPTYGDVLAVLYANGEARMSTIADMVGREPSTVTALVQKLQKLGYVEMLRDESDCRVGKVRLMQTGKADLVISSMTITDECHPLPVLPRSDIDESRANPKAEPLSAWIEGRMVGGAVAFANRETREHECALLYVAASEHSKGIGTRLWRAIEDHYSEHPGRRLDGKWGEPKAASSCGNGRQGKGWRQVSVSRFQLLLAGIDGGGAG